MYPKIRNPFYRNPTTHRLMEGEWIVPELGYLACTEWEFTEKIDGMNIRVMFDEEGQMRIGGRTDKAQLPEDLVDKVTGYFAGVTATNTTFYGEGYGGKIQKGSRYRPDKDFILFDVRHGNYWESQDGVRSWAANLGIGAVPLIEVGTLWDGIEIVRTGLTSTFGDFEAEGLIARPTRELRCQNGERIITKIKARDFVA